jgi:hypothetical protein
LAEVAEGYCKAELLYPLALRATANERTRTGSSGGELFDEDAADGSGRAGDKYVLCHKSVELRFPD